MESTDSDCAYGIVAKAGSQEPAFSFLKETKMADTIEYKVTFSHRDFEFPEALAEARKIFEEFVQTVFPEAVLECREFDAEEESTDG